MTDLIQKFEKRAAHVVVVGIGYVGLPLVVEFGKAGFRVTGLDKDPEKVRLLNKGESYIGDIPTSELGPLVSSGKVDATTSEDILAKADAVIVCVPTPLNKTKEPDMRFIVDATDAICRHTHPNQVVVLESTTYPGTTREVVVPKLEASGRTVGKDIFVAFSPERVDPGNKVWKTKNTPKVLGGVTPECLKHAQALYQNILDRVVPVSSTDAAEMVKLLENTFRAVNIGLVNEIALMCEKLGLDSWEVIDAAATKPFGFMPFYPGPGLGGHCIPIDPLYLSWRLRALKYTARFIELADDINSNMPAYVVRKTASALNKHKKSVNGSKVLVVGVAYKRDVDDVRESPAIDVISLLRDEGADVSYHDPHVPKLEEHGLTLDGVAAPQWGSYDATVIVTDHKALDIPKIVRESKIVIDTRNATRGITDVPADRIYKL
ncbi:MAG: nucleotide sugar dehydrogenase [Deltaproteobacteria bacterium]|nr:nucleotide sugar dehydrogenase [Deltaproteobacteria bacterium]